MILKPPLKCLGGKSKIVKILDTNLPQDFSKKEWVYDEPFLGGGAFLLHLITKYPQSVIKRAYGNELNEHVAYVWTHTIHYPTVLLNHLEDLAKIDYSENFDQVRLWFNDHCKVGSVDKSAHLIYLNKTCFNGLTRFNKSGKFNSPIGKYSNPTIYFKDDILNLSNALKDRVTIFNDDFQKHIETMIKQKHYGKNTFVYLDPPYIPKSITANFTSYTSEGFGLYDHKRLKLSLDLLDSRGVKFLLSNSATDLTTKIYQGYNVTEIDGKRSVSAKTVGRQTVKEVLIKNY